MREILMPRLDPEMKEGTILEWLKKEGSKVRKGEPIARVEGEKVVFEVEAPDNGILAKVIVKEGTSVPVGQSIAILAETEEEITRATIIETPPVKIETFKKQISGEPEVSRLNVEKLESLVGMRKTIAERMTYSYRTIPHVAITMEVNMSETLKLKETFEKKLGTRIPFSALMAKIVAYALRKYPLFNATLDEDSNQIKIFKEINIGIAIAVEDGLVVPVVHDADKKSLLEIASIIKGLIQKASERKLTAEELRDGTFTITNLGSFGVDVFTPIINPPQVAILGIGRIKQEPRASAEEIRVVPVMTLTLVFDHRVTDGAKAAQFLKEIRDLLEKPGILFEN